MKYLDEQIEIAFEDLTVNKSGTYRYTIENITGNIIFVGNVFITAGEYEIVVNITDIVSNYAYINNSIKNYEANSDRIIEIFTGYLYVDGLVRESSSDYIYLAYRYPHLLKRLELIEGNTQYNI